VDADHRRRPGEDVSDLYEILVTTHVHGRASLPVDDDMTWRPATDAYETAEAFVVQMELAGMDPAAIAIVIEDGVLVIRGVRDDIAPSGKKHYYKMEINVGPFCRRITLPEGLSPLSAVARYRSGFLFVTIRKGRRRDPQRRRIEVE